MADIFLRFVVEGILTRLFSLITEKIILTWGLSDELKCLQQSLSMMRDVLQDAEEQQVTQKSVRRWLKKLEDVAYDAEDVLGEFAYEILRQTVEIQNQLEAKVSEFFPFSKSTRYLKKAVFHVKMAHKVRDINESLDKIKREVADFGLRVTCADRALEGGLDRVTESVLDNSKVVGRKDDVSKIVNLLTCFSNQQVLIVVSIVGMGGLGKSTLAKLVCKEGKEKKLFDVTI
ncbi:hypothetical protein JCGZ_01204 [Jatropha curcas]|uniref:Rx N-terminal domain-containing protein n=1 Tax=Jatropha curcas TaxID=180498 RepID=A0A067LK89_JATCU|nr:hypothetical protein JCGZ_01204 [Jatropha curcas]